jgi:hypothetical protein
MDDGEIHRLNMVQDGSINVKSIDSYMIIMDNPFRHGDS